MGRAFYTNHAGRECGYGVPAICDHPGCAVEIDRGYDYLCGTTDAIDGRGPGCGMYFCAMHLGWVRELKDRRCASLCEACKDNPENTKYFAVEGDES